MGRVFVRRQISQIAICLCVALTVAPSTVWAQGATATLSGTVVDESGAHVPGAALTLLNTATDIKRETVSSPEGSFVLPSLPPGRYTLRAHLEGFGPIQMENIVLNVDDRLAVRIQLKVAPVGAAVTVVAEPARVSTSPAVSTVIDRQFVENLPLNGRSFQSLLELTPGVVMTKSNADESGQFSVNGQRTNANYFLVDGVSANVGIMSAPSLDTLPGQSGSGSSQAMNALGLTSGLVSVDALQEFRVQTSSYAPEFGRMPGGQISMVTRSGTNSYRGSIFEYFRDESMDASDWFQKRAHLPKPPLMQHDFGGVVGGPISRNKLFFFFFSYEGLRLKEPQTKVASVPTLAVRQSAAAELQPLINAFPLPTGADRGNGLQEFVASYSDPSHADSTSLKIDHHTPRLTTFVRVNHAPSYIRQRSGNARSYIVETNQNASGITATATWIISTRLLHDSRLNYTVNDAPSSWMPDNFGGATPPPVSVFGPGLTPENSTLFFATTGGLGWGWGKTGPYKQRQINVVDTLTFSTSSHSWKFGLDYRRMFPQVSGGESGFETLRILFPNLSGNGTGLYFRYVMDRAERAVAFDNLSLYAQDTWRTSGRLTMDYGIRWELVPPPHAIQGPQAITLQNLDDPYGGHLSIAPPGTPLWLTRYDKFAPRLGASYVLSRKPGAELVLRAATGVFYDLGYGLVASSYAGFPFVASKLANGVPVPVNAATKEPPKLGVDPPRFLYVMDPNLDLPLTYQWNVAVEQAVGSKQTLTVTYVGAAGRKLLKRDLYHQVLLDWPGQSIEVNVNRNRGFSSYRGLQLQFQRRLSAGLQALVSYTLGHARDTSSSDARTNIPPELLPPEKDFGDSDFDVRHVLAAALTYQTPGVGSGGVVTQLTRNWGLDLMLRARSGFPYTVGVDVPFFPETVSARPNIVPGQPFWLEAPRYLAGVV